MSESGAVASYLSRTYMDLPIISSSFEMATIWRGIILYNASSILINSFWTIGSPVTHENLPINWPDFAASTARLGWPACNRHTVACIHRFSHILRLPPEPVVWFMSESGAVASYLSRTYTDLPIISSSFEMATIWKGLRTSFNGTVCLDFINPHEDYLIKTIPVPVTKLRAKYWAEMGSPRRPFHWPFEKSC